MKMVKRLVVAASLALIVGALMASPAFATGTKWNVTGFASASVKGTLTLKKDGASPVACTIPATSVSTFNEESAATIGTLWYENRVTCANGLVWGWGLDTEVTAGGSKLFMNFTECCTAVAAPWAGRAMFEGGNDAPFTNGSGTTASHVDFTETEIGLTTKGEKVTATGKIEIFRSGGLVTVSTF
ncbi:MAG TPA: hypothetical protein VLL27_08740 [Solirubrobacterales bacterium]|nr:hypothetical protein [Solirubrobacterales bacterium]